MPLSLGSGSAGVTQEQSFCRGGFSARWTTNFSTLPDSGGHVTKFSPEKALLAFLGGRGKFYKATCSPPSGQSTTAVEQTWNTQDNQGPVLALAFRQKSLTRCKLFSLRSEAALKEVCRSTSFMKNSPLLRPYSKAKPSDLLCSQGGRSFLMSEISLWCERDTEEPCS